MLSVLKACHSSPMSGHHSGIRNEHNILPCGYYCATIHQDAHDLTKSCDRCQQDRENSKRQELSLKSILLIEIFDVWGTEFMVPFMNSHKMKYIIMVVDNVPKWVEATALPNSEGKSVSAFLKKNIFSRFGTPVAITSDGGSHFYNKLFKGLVKKYVIRHNVATHYHPRLACKLKCSMSKSNRLWRKL